MSRLLAVTVLILGVLAAWVAPAAASATTIVIPAGTHRTIDGSPDANIVVEEGASVFLEDADVRGDILLHHAGGMSAYRSTVEGSIVGSVQDSATPGSTGIGLSLTEVFGRVAVSAPSRHSHADLTVEFGSEIDYGVVSDGLSVRIDDAIVRHHLVIIGAHDVASGGFEGYGDHRRSHLCQSRVYGPMTVRDSTGYLDLGGGKSCLYTYPLSTIVWGKTRIEDNDATSISVAGVYHSDVVCTGNTHHPVGDTAGHRHTVVSGHALAQCADLP